MAPDKRRNTDFKSIGHHSKYTTTNIIQQIHSKINKPVAFIVVKTVKIFVKEN